MEQLGRIAGNLQAQQRLGKSVGLVLRRTVSG